MKTPPDPDLVELIRRVDPEAELIAAEAMLGGVSAEIMALDLMTPGGPAAWVLRTLPDDPDLDAATEFALTRWLHARGFPIALPLALIEASQVRPQGAVLMQRVSGERVSDPSAGQIRVLADCMTQLHALPISDLGFLPPLRGQSLPDTWRDLDPARMADLRLSALSHPPGVSGAPVLCHGDYWPGNLLWRADGSVVVLDWEDAGIGDRLHDLAVARLELLWECGEATMQRFTDEYLDRVPDAAALRGQLPAHDLAVTLRRLAWLPDWGLPHATARWCLELGAHHAERAASQLRPQS